VKDSQEFEREHQQLVKEAHCLIAAFASRPGSLKLLRITVGPNVAKLYPSAMR
jgi:hypothetical protein